MTRFQPVAVLACLLAFTAFAEQKSNGKSETPTAVLNLTVLKDSNGKPVKNAEIVLHPVDEHGRQKQESLELKTHDDGKAGASGIAYGKVRVQVIARGYRTFGDDYVVDQLRQKTVIKLEKRSQKHVNFK